MRHKKRNIKTAGIAKSTFKNGDTPEIWGLPKIHHRDKKTVSCSVLIPDGLGWSQFQLERCRGQEEEGGGKERAARSRQISARNNQGGNGDMRDPASMWRMRESDSGTKVPL